VPSHAPPVHRAKPLLKRPSDSPATHIQGRSPRNPDATVRTAYKPADQPEFEYETMTVRGLAEDHLEEGREGGIGDDACFTAAVTRLEKAIDASG